MIWKRFNSLAASSALVVGVAMTFLTLGFPEWIYPLRDFFYGAVTKDPFLFRALFGMLVSSFTGVFVCLMTPKKIEKKILAYTISGLDLAAEMFKGGKPNFERGGKSGRLEVRFDESLKEGEISLSDSVALKIKARLQDIVYTCDARWFLAGLRSVHLRLGGLHKAGESVILMSKKTFDRSYLLEKKKVFVKKIL